MGMAISVPKDREAGFAQSGGASYGGVGGTGAYGGAGGAIYGSLTQPNNIGSGGGTDNCGAIGGTGGGAAKLVVGGNANISGTISAKGQAGSGGCWQMGGGSGGVFG